MPSGPFVHEVTIAAPDIIAVELRDPPYVPGRLVPVGRTLPEPLGAWVQREGTWGLVVGRNRDHVRLQDTPPASYLDRRRIDAASRYEVIGAEKVLAVYRKSVPYDTGFARGDGGEDDTRRQFPSLRLPEALRPVATGTQRHDPLA